MITFAKLKSKAAIFRSLTGLTVEAFEQLMPAFAEAYEADLEAREQQREQPRQRQRGGGRIGVLDSLAMKLVFILFYFRFYPVQTVLAFFFDMGQPQANEWIHRLTPILHRALGYEQQLPTRKSRDVAAVLKACPGLEFIIDGTERPIRRPQDSPRRDSYYSGKKKRHTVKNLLVTDKGTGKIKFLSPTCEGRKHDKRLAEEAAIPFPANSKLWQDTGFQGYCPSAVIIIQPTKKPRGGSLTVRQKDRNRRISRHRIAIEHSLAGVKTYQIVSAPFRNLCQGFDDLVMAIACGLHNLRLDFPATS